MLQLRSKPPLSLSLSLHYFLLYHVPLPLFFHDVPIDLLQLFSKLKIYKDQHTYKNGLSYHVL